MLSGINADLAFPLLVGRPQIESLGENALPHIKGKTVLVTGGGGSIGSELVRQVAQSDPARLIVADLSEYALYEIAQTLENSGTKVPYETLLLDVRHDFAVEQVFTDYAPEIVLHAAALKHVPLMEHPHNRIEAARTNILGTWNVLTQAIQNGAEQFVMISTDKAVNPSSWMGATKRAAEILTFNAVAKNLQKSVVRFGNVLGSSGSVVPLFRRQIAQGGPVTVTHPDMTRYFMSIREAVELVLEASRISDESRSGQGLFVLDMGKPVRITELAYRLIEQAGLRPGRDVKIEYTGLRPGEKLYEELSYAKESLQATSNPRVLRSGAFMDGASGGSIYVCLDGLKKQVDRRDVTGVEHYVRELVPDYHCQCN